MYLRNEEAEYFVVTSWCNGGINKADLNGESQYGSCIGNSGVDIPMLTNVIVTMDDRSGDVIEARNTLDEKDMKIMEQDPQFLAFASLDSSPFALFNELMESHKFVLSIGNMPLRLTIRGISN